MMAEGQGIRGASAIAHTDVLSLVLTKKDYQSILQTQILVERQKRQNFLQKLSFFKDWHRVKLIDLNILVQEMKFQQDSIIYEIGQLPSTFYVVREGKLIMETIIEVESYYKYPTDKHEWEVRKKTKRLQYKLQDLGKGSIFGYEEML